MMSFIAYALFAVSFSTGLMYLIVRSEERTESSYIFWTVTLGIFVVTLAAMGLDYLTFKMAVKSQEEFIKGYLFRATFRNESAVISLVSVAASAAFIFLIWRYGGILKKVISSFNISAEALDDLTYKSIAIGFPIFTLGGLIFVPYGQIRPGVNTGPGTRRRPGRSSPGSSMHSTSTAAS